jgi:integrase
LLLVRGALPGIHRVRRPRADGGVAEYWYAWRGGPRILYAAAASDLLLDQEIARSFPQAANAYARHHAERKTPDRVSLYGLITRYLQSAEFARAAPRTRKDRRTLLDRVRNDLGEMELRALEARGARAALLAWRDRYASTPKTADELAGVASKVMQWAVDRGELQLNPLAGFPRLYRVNRAEAVWEASHLTTLLAHTAPEFTWVVRLAALSGLRLGDLIRLPWSAVGEHAIVWQTGKSRGRTTAVIPIYDELRQLLAEIPRTDSPTILNSARGRAWTAPGIESAFRRAKLDAAQRARDVTGEAIARSGIEHLRFHDLRGTAATNFIRAGLELDDVATILGWVKVRVEQIAARYVTGEEIGLAMVQRLRQAKAAAL